MVAPLIKGRRRLSVLFVEGEGLVGSEIREHLSRLGFDVAGVAGSGEQAILAAQALQPDLILMDIRLKGEMDGIETAAHIGELLNIPVLLTAHSDSQRARESAPFGYLLKPCQEKDLAMAIEMATHQHFLAQRLKDSEQKYASTLASIGDAVATTDAEGRITYLNPVAEALTGWRTDEAEGIAVERVFSVIREANQTVMENPVRRALREGKVVHFTEPALLVSRNQDLIPIDDSAAPITTDRGNVIGAVVAFRDIRERRLAEDALHRAEQVVRQSQKLKAIGQLAGGIAHDFNNLLTVINGYSDLLMSSGSLDKASMRVVGEILKAGERAAALTKQLLLFSRRQALSPELLDPNVLVASLENLLRRLIGEDIILTIKFGADLYKIQADPSQLEQVIMNLAVNSRDAMPTGGHLNIETGNCDIDEAAVQMRPEIKAGRYVMLSVSDTGCGFDEAVKANIFEPFFTTKALGKGTGIGLATVYGIVRQSDGFIYVDSEPGAGATFKIYFPAAPEAAKDSAAGQIAIPSESPTQGSETIILVEDEEKVRVVSSSILERFGYTVLQASDGEEAIRLSAQFKGKIDLVVTDVVMPGMSGPQLAERLVALRPDVRVLYLSGYTEEAVSRHQILETKVPFLQKPFAPAALAAKVRQTLDDQLQ